MFTVRNLNLNFKYLSCQDTQKETPEVIPIEDAPYMKYKLYYVKFKNN